MNIEIAPKEYWKKLNYDDGMFYCKLLTIDGKNEWRMIREEEFNEHNMPKEYWNDDFWFFESGIFTDFDDFGLYNYKAELMIVPVREI